MNDELFNALEAYVPSSKIGNGYRLHTTVANGTQTNALMVEGFIERNHESTNYFRLTDLGLMAYYKEKYMYSREVIHQAIELATYLSEQAEKSTELDAARFFNASNGISAILAILQGTGQWEDDKFTIVLANPRQDTFTR